MITVHTEMSALKCPHSNVRTEMSVLKCPHLYQRNMSMLQRPPNIHTEMSLLNVLTIRTKMS
jgi:hypothetical protein